MKILVTGNMGYIGPSVVRQLRKSYPGATIIGFDIGYFAHNLTSIDYYPEVMVDTQYFGDVRNFPEQILNGIDAVVNLAAISNDPIGNAFEKITMQVNYQAAIDIATKAKKAGVSTYVYASSCSVYGFAEDGARTERSDVNPLTAYAKSKVQTEKELELLACSTFKVTSLRFSTACGISSRLRLDLVLNDFVASAFVNKKIIILSDGTPWRPLINIEDMARAIDWAICREVSLGGYCLNVNIGSDEWNYQIKDLASAVADMIPGTEVCINKDGQPDKRSYKVNFDLFRTLAPNHQPIYDLKRTIVDLQKGLEAINFGDTKFRESSLIRLKNLNMLRSKGLLTDNLSWSVNY